MTIEFDPKMVRYMTSIDEVRALHPAPMSRATDKVLTRLDRHCHAILARATFCVIGTHGRSGADVSPRGDPPGFAVVLDDRHLLIPDRIGNNRFDSYANIFENGVVGLLFLVPGMAETLRINGQARLTDEPGLLALCAVQERVPRVALIVEVREAFLHCAKSINRGRLWDAAAQIDRAELPSYGDMLVDHCEGLTRAESERQGEEMARRGYY